eukprot:TRINITY_DN56312_c0_g1_i1.p1 TRINITY_DN56312_c0_g1~~TRINITY_DN56312_c0_g1_i1.p1  ORF type:complete len:289 (-),score=63.07 TRINITY_DN56312_c0_g1_i1:64-930(-)
MAFSSAVARATSSLRLAGVSRCYPIAVSRCPWFPVRSSDSTSDSGGGGIGNVAAAAMAAAASVAAAVTINKTSEIVRCEAVAVGDCNLDAWAKELGAGAIDEFDLKQFLKPRDDKQFIRETLSGDRRLRRLRIWHFGRSEDVASSSNAATNPSQSSAPDSAGTAGDAVETVVGKTRLVALVDIGDELNGHIGIVHGGFTAALLDELFGWGAGVEGRKVREGSTKPYTVFTANLHINYRSPMKSNQAYAIEINCEKVVKQRKIYLKATVRDAQGKLVADGTSLYILRKA